MDEVMKKILYILVAVMLFGCEESEPKTNTFHSKRKTKEVEQSVIERKVIVKNVYVNEDEYSSYTSDETGSSYWYVYYQSKVVRGYQIVEIDVPYFNVGKILRVIREENKIKNDEFTSINYTKRVSFDSWKAFQTDSDGN